MATRLDQKDFVKTALRLPPDLHESVHASAEKSGRSYNAELVHLVERGLKAPDAYIHAPKLVRSVDSEGNYSEQNSNELFAELTQHLQRAFMIAGLFQEYADGPPSIPDIDNVPDWVREADERDTKEALEQVGAYAPPPHVVAAEASSANPARRRKTKP